jgi:putative protease
MDDDIYISPISSLNELRRNALAEYENKLISSFKRRSVSKFYSNNIKISLNNYKVSLLLNTLNLDFDYLNISGADRIYIPFKYWINKSFGDILTHISNKFDTYIYLPCIMRNNYLNLFKNNIDKIIDNFKIKGFVISNIGQFELLNSYNADYDFVGNYTLNLFNYETAKNLNVSTICVSPELDKDTISNLVVPTHKEVIAYGNLPLMNSNYCLLGKSNKCYKDCDKKCMNNNSYFLKDRLGFLFKIVPDNIDTVTTIYNSKITSISMEGLNCDYARIDILNETIEDINYIISKILNKERLEGNQYTNGNLNKIV